MHEEEIGSKLSVSASAIDLICMDSLQLHLLPSVRRCSLHAKDSYRNIFKAPLPDIQQELSLICWSCAIIQI